MFQRTKTFWRELLSGPAGSASVALEDSPQERRSSFRVPANFETRAKPAGAADSSFLPTHVHDVSLGGIKLRCGQAFQPGELLSVELPTRDGQGPGNVLACVVHCTQASAAEWSLGCTFSQELSED